MQTISWNDDLKLGIKSVDNQHRRMVNTANEFITAANMNSKGLPLARIIAKLREEATEHLSIEDQIMAEARYSRRSVRSLENERFKVMLRELQRRIKNKGKPSATDIKQFRETLLTHIMRGKNAIIRCLITQ